MYINVTEADIRNGLPSDSSDCAIARALYLQTGEQWYVEDAICYKTDLETVYDLPLSAQEFIASFDCGESVEPFGFEIEVSEYELVEV